MAVKAEAVDDEVSAIVVAAHIIGEDRGDRIGLGPPSRVATIADRAAELDNHRFESSVAVETIRQNGTATSKSRGKSDLSMTLDSSWLVAHANHRGFRLL